MHKKIILSFLTLTFLVTGVFLFFSVVRAEEKSSAKNPLCWTRKMCDDFRLSKEWTGNGFFPDEECKGNDFGGVKEYDWGKCLAGAQTTLQVSFGGVGGMKITPDIGNYIKVFYNYALVILSIFASIMIIVAGIQYVGSAGSQEMIASAKKKITGALIGLALAYMSYTILNMVNPATINLRLPQVYMIREMALSKLCKDVDDGVFKDLKNSVFTQTAASVINFKEKTTSTVSNKNETQCGKEYSDPLGNNCMGSNCHKYLAVDEDGQTNNSVVCGENGVLCACVAGGSHPSGYMCKLGMLGGTITLTNKEKYVDSIILWWVERGTFEQPRVNYDMIKIQEIDTDEQDKNYVLEKPWITMGWSLDYVSTTKDKGGYLLVIEVNDPSGISSVNDNWILDKKSCSGQGPLAGINEVGYDLDDNTRVIQVNDPLYPGPIEKAELITVDDMEFGFTCDLNIDSRFPDINDSMTKYKHPWHGTSFYMAR